MSETNTSVNLYVFVLVLNLVFPVLGYTLTSFGSTPEDYEISLDENSLLAIGINFEDAESHNLSYNGGWVEYTLLNLTIRAQFMDNVKYPWFTNVGDGIGFQRKGIVGTALNSWFPPAEIGVKSFKTNELEKLIANDTIVNEYDSNYNWTRFILVTGHQVFVTPNSGGNITKAVYVDGHVNVTIAKAIAYEDSNFNFWTFIGWYSSMMIGSQSWGLPVIFSWFLRIIGALSIYSFVMLARYMVKL